MRGVSVCSFTFILDLADFGVTLCSFNGLDLVERGVIVCAFTLLDLLEQGVNECFFSRFLVLADLGVHEFSFS